MIAAPHRYGSLPAVFALWLALVFATLVSRPPLPVDETRVLSAAWEMWTRGQFLVPHLNGEPYSHKPPLLFWLTLLGWKVTGVNDWWPRLISPLFALGSLFLTARLAQRLWPEHRDAAELAPVVLLGASGWVFYSTALMYDMPLTFFALAGVLGLIDAWQGRVTRGMLTLGVAIGLGILTKGPVILLHVLVPAALAPLWMVERRPVWRHWYLGVAGALALGLLIAGAWAIPAAASGGKAYSDAILWGQSADRLVSSFAHRRPLWWYLPVLPALLLPWIVWPAMWRGLRSLLRAPLDAGTRLALLWSGTLLVVFSAISGKQVHYMLPILPAIVLLAARSQSVPSAVRPGDAWTPGIALVLLGAVAFADRFIRLPEISQSSATVGAACVAAGIGVMAVRFGSSRREAAKIAVAMTVIGATFAIGSSSSWTAYDLRPIGARLKELETRGVPVVHLGLYHGQFQFAGRLERALDVAPVWELGSWFARHPDGRAIVYLAPDDPLLARAEFRWPFRSQMLAIIDRQTAEVIQARP